MAVVTRYVVVRNEREEGVFTTQQEADAYDAMLDRAEKLAELLASSGETLGLAEQQIDQVARLLAGKPDEMLAIFAAKGAKRGAPPKAPRQKSMTDDDKGDKPVVAKTPFPQAVGQN